MRLGVFFIVAEMFFVGLMGGVEPHRSVGKAGRGRGDFASGVCFT